MYEIRKNYEEENVFVQRRLIEYLEKTNPNDLLINATIKYPQFKDDSKKLKLFLLNIVSGEGDSVVGIVGNGDRYIA